MKINRSNLQEALKAVEPGLATKDTIEQATSFAFLDTMIVTYNDEISISHPVEGLNIKGAIKAKELYQLLSKIKEEEINIEKGEGEIKITAGKVKAGLRLDELITLPLEEIGEWGKWKNLPKEFIEAVTFASFSCGKEMSKATLTCVNVTKEGLLQSCDNYRVTQYQIDKMPIPSFLIPAATVQQLAKYKPIQITSGVGWVHFKTEEETIFSCRVFADKFPEIAMLFDIEGGTEFEFPKATQEILDKALIFAKRDYKLDEKVMINIADRKMVVKAQNDYGWFEESANIKFKGKLSFSINLNFLNTIIGKISSCTFTKDRLKFEGENWEHVISLHKEKGKK